VAGAINDLLSDATDLQLRALPRRDLVWALQVLLWWPTTWATAADSLYRFARTENEEWANNSSGVLVGTFAVVLSGTTVAFSERVRWLEARIATAQREDLPILARAA
jgi:hypothetical protein